MVKGAKSRERADEFCSPREEAGLPAGQSSSVTRTAVKMSQFVGS